MKIDRRLVLIGVMVIVLSMTMATQYATTKIGYEYTIVNPSNADIRFIASDNSSDKIRVLRVENNDTAPVLKIILGNVSIDVNKTFTAAFGIVNEELYNVTITHINLSDTAGNDYMQIWLHGDRSARAGDDAGTCVLMYDGTNGDAKFSSISSAWGLHKGDADPTTMRAGAISTPWDGPADVRYSESNIDAVNNTDDYVWVQISIDVPSGVDIVAPYSGTIYVHTRSTTFDE